MSSTKLGTSEKYDEENNPQNCQFEYNLEPLDPNEMELFNYYDFEYEFESKTVSHQIFEKLKTFISSWIGDLSPLKINRKDSIFIFNLVNKLIGEFSDSIIGLLDGD